MPGVDHYVPFEEDMDPPEQSGCATVVAGLFLLGVIALALRLVLVP